MTSNMVSNCVSVHKKVVQYGAGLNWTQTHGQFAQMGGFARKDNKHVLYPETLIELLVEGCIDLDQLKLTKDDIDDKSKGDVLSKALVAFQTVLNTRCPRIWSVVGQDWSWTLP